MVPKLTGLRQGSGEHIHVSLSPTEHEEHFLAGILSHLPGSCAVTMPYAQSYSRIGKREAGEWEDWGTENREAAVRKIESGHWEIRCADASANMYLAVASIVAAGCSGIEERLPLQSPDASLVSDGTDADSGEVPARLPRTFGDALQLLQASLPHLDKVFQSNILSRYVALKQVESTRLAQLDQDEVDRLMVTFF